MAGLVFGLFPATLAAVLYPVGLAGIPLSVAPSFALWHGVNAPLLLSLTAFAAGFALFHFRAPVRRFQESVRPLWTFDRLYSMFWDVTLAWAKRATGLLQNGNLSWYSGLFFAFLSVIVLASVFHGQTSIVLAAERKPVLPFDTFVIAGIVASSLLVVFLRERLTRVVTIGVVGVFMCALFALRGAPDLALTGFLVEIVMFIVVLVVLKQLPLETVPAESKWHSAGKAAIAAVGGSLFGFLVYMVLQAPLAESIHPYFARTSEALAGGLNVVNVILVDYRGFDTFGEILVLCLAGLGVFGLRTVWVGGRAKSEPPKELKMKSLPPSQILSAISAVAIPLTLILALYLTLRGHNSPGGGFIGGLTFAAGLILEMLAVGRRRFLALIGVKGHVLYSIGLALALVTGLVPMLFGLPFLTSAVVQSVHFSTATFFDLGVFLVVVGVTLDLVTLLEEGEREGADA